jgi:hypothetical protein
VKNDRAMGMVMGSGWRVVVYIILKNVLLFFGFFFAILNLPSVFLSSAFRQSLPSVRKNTRQRTICR